MITLRTYLRTGRRDGQGQSFIYFIVGEEWISSKIKVHPDYWDEDTSSILKKHPQYYTVNPVFQLYKSRAEQCISNYQTSGNVFDKMFFKVFVFANPNDAENPSISALIKEYTDIMDLSLGRIKHYDALENHLLKVSPILRIKDINYSFALKFLKYLRKQGNKQNTLASKIKALKAIVHFALRKELIAKDPLKDIHVKEVEGTKKYLTADELQTLETLYQQGTLKVIQQNVLRYFLFSCYTALRYSDIVKLKYYDIKDNCVSTTQEKTEKPVMIPLISKAKKLLQQNATGLCFKTHSNQVTNRCLKEIMITAGINKKITSHCGRHTFGTLSIYWGIPKEVVADLMGIDFATAEVYAKIVDEVKYREMRKWEANDMTARVQQR